MMTKPPVKPELGPFAIIDAILAEGQRSASSRIFERLPKCR
jgi:hypothetical protein